MKVSETKVQNSVQDAETSERSENSAPSARSAPSAGLAHSEQANLETRQRLLEAAGEVFAEKGFRCATIREIKDRAKANVAAVNYHFGDKQGLYTAVLKYACACSNAKYPPDLGVGVHDTPAMRLHAYVRSFLLRIFDEGRPAWHGKLEAREMMEPTAALDAMVHEQIRPKAELLMAIVRSILGPRADDRLIWDCVGSVVGQCVFYHHSRPVIIRLNPSQQYRPQDIEAMATHITRFSLSALKCLAEEIQWAVH